MTSGVGVDVDVGEVTSSKHGHTFADLACCGGGGAGLTCGKASVVLVICVKQSIRLPE